MRRFALLLVTIVSLLGLPQQVRAQSGVEVTDVRMFFEFGQYVTIQARIVSPVPVLSAIKRQRAAPRRFSHEIVQWTGIIPGQVGHQYG